MCTGNASGWLEFEMTTLPQVTPLRLPRPGSNQLTVPNQVLPAVIGPQSTAAPQMTGGDVWRVLRANLWLIILFLVLSAGIGYGVNTYLLRHYASYTATAIVKVLPPTTYDPARGLITITDSGSFAVHLHTEA